MAETPRQSAPQKYQVPGAGAPTAGGPASTTVLIVDDDADITRYVGAVLASRGIQTIVAYDPTQGFLAAERQQPRLILVDWHMPAGGGPELLRKLRDNPRTVGIPVIVVTGDSAPNLPEEAAALGARLFFHKPLDPERLVEIVVEFGR
jgi:two-component system chemotaxis response regulator CheY